MLRRILYFIAALLLVFLPVAGTIILSDLSPYFNESPWGVYIAGWIGYLLISAIAGWLLARKTFPKPLFYGGFILFQIGSALVAVGGLKAAPDFGANMLLHPEREHFRYIFLFFAAICFAGGVVLILRHLWPALSKLNRWIVLFFVFSIIEIFWEFSHQFQAYSHLKSWVEQGNKTEDFEVHYFMPTLYLGCIGRICQYILIAWLALILMQKKLMRIWAFVVICFFCSLGITSAAGIILTDMNLPKNMQILMIFFIPAAPLLLLYWEAVALLTRKYSSPAIES